MLTDVARCFASLPRFAAGPLAAALVLACAAPAAAQDGPPPELYPELPPPPFEPPAHPPPKNRSGWALGVDFNGGYSAGSSNGRLGGFGSDFRFGYRFALGPMFVVPEVTTGFASFPALDTAARLGAGLRLAVDAGVVEPSIYAAGGGFANVWKNGPALRAGAALDFRVRKTFAFGVHADYDEAWWNVGNATFDTPALTYVSWGMHIGWVL
jgi:hypothetical protein